MDTTHDRDTLEPVRRLYDSFARGDIGGAVGVMDPRIRWAESESHPYSPDGSPFVGPDEVVERVFARLATEWDGFAATPESFHDLGDVVVVEGRYTGRHLATGRRLDAQFCHVYGVDGDRLVRMQQYTDTAQFQQVMGVA